MIVDIQNDLALLDSMSLLDPLLEDRTTGKSILWATDAYAERGRQYEKDSRITRETLIPEGILRTRAQKESAQQDARTRQHAEVFTPLWVVCKMSDYADEEWFGYPDVFFKDGKPVPDKIRFWDNRKTWKDYVDSRRLEITCGEAPFLVTRYDVETGEILPVQERAGILDRKLRVVGENTDTAQAWITWAARAVEATYGYEFQGDSLLIARLNVLMTVRDFMEDRFGQTLTEIQFGRLIQTVVWNLWQMDGLTDRIPIAAEEEPDTVGLLFGMMQEQENTDCRIHDWRTGLDVPYYRLKEDLYKVGEKSMKFDFIIGNPPYQVQNAAGTTDGNRSMPVYHTFMEATYELSSKTLLITPARFLFDAGKTPRDFNQRMLHDKHFRVVKYWPNSADVFSGVDIKGGVSITYRDLSKEYKEIGVMLPFAELFEIVDKVQNVEPFIAFSGLFRPKYSYHFAQIIYDENPSLVGCMSKEHKYDMESNVFDLMPGAFTDQATQGEESACIYGRTQNQRTKKYLPERYITYPDNYNYFKIMVPISNGSGAFGEPLSTPFIAKPKEGNTVTFLSIGAFTNEMEANRCLVYLKTKFLRALLGALKITQHNPASVWSLIPNQDYSESSDINWMLPVSAIDQQLYHKYCLSNEQITFIETHVKEMT